MPSLYFTKGILYAFVFVVALIMLRRTGLSIDETTFYIGLCYLPWVAKCWWKPLVARTKNCWQLILLIELLLVPAFSMLAFALPTEWKTVALLLLIAFFTAIHNVAVDMLYHCQVSSRYGNYQVLKELSRKMADIVCIGILIMFVGNLQVVYRNALLYSWRTMVFIMSFLMLVLFFWHLIVLPRHTCKELPTCDEPKFERSKSMLAFVLLFLFAPTMINKMSVLFLISNQSSGGLGLSPQELGFVLGTIGVIALTFGMMSGFYGVEDARNIEVKNAVVRWKAEGVTSSNTELSRDGYLFWNTVLHKGERHRAEVIYPRSYFMQLDENQQATRAQSGSDDDDSLFSIIAIIVVAPIVVIISFGCVVT